MFDFRDVQVASKTEQIRAWAIESAIDSYAGADTTSEAIVHRASKIEEFILKGKEES